MRTSWLKLIIVAFIAALVAGGIWWWASQRRTPAVPPSAGTPEITDAERCGAVADSTERTQCLAVGYAKWLGSVKQSAFEGQDHRRCGVIPVANERDLCVLEFVDAFPATPDACGTIVEPARQADCQLRIVSQGNDFSACAKIPDAAGRDYCYASVLAGFAGGGEKLCPQLAGADGERCWELFHTSEALRNADYDRCKKISPDAGRQRCLEALPRDSDGDGLSDYLEQSRYETDPQNPDTDGDGFSDGQEVKGGYNPKGPGKLK